jgi:DNA-binding transcriptional regulator YdaS (Cro superfamily)
MESKAREILAQAIADRNDARGIGGSAKVAAELGCTASLVSQLASGVYKSPRKWTPLIIEKYGNETVACPVIGEITQDRCRAERERPYSMANPTRGELSRTCPKCGVKP